jgi:hypothetical protein
MSSVLDSVFSRGLIYNPGAKSFVSQRVQRMAEIIHDYDPYLSLVWIPPEDRDNQDDKPFGVMHSPPGKAPYMVFVCSETELDERLLVRLWTSDMKKHNVFELMELSNRARQVYDLKVKSEELQEAGDKAVSILRSPLHKYQLSKGVVIGS